MRKMIKLMVMAGVISLVASPALARTIGMKDAGVALWIFIIVGAIIVLMQLIPAVILFFSFIGTASAAALKRKGDAKEAEVPVVGKYEPSGVKE